MKNTLIFFAGGIVALVFVLLVSCAGCAWDPITPPRRPYAPRPNPYLKPTNAPPATGTEPAPTARVGLALA